MSRAARTPCRAAAGHGDGLLAALRTAAVTGGLANLVDNLPANYAMEGVVGSDQTHVLAVVLGANVGPLVLLWGSLATLLWRNAAWHVASR